MACKNCGKQRKIVSQVTNQMANTNLEQDENFKLITYHQSGSHSRIVPSPTGVIREYGMQNYGFFNPGKQFYVHVDDIEASPNIFVVIVPETPVYSNTIRSLIEQGKLDANKVKQYEERISMLIEEGLLDSADSDTTYEESYIIELLTNTQPESIETVDGVILTLDEDGNHDDSKDYVDGVVTHTVDTTVGVGFIKDSDEINPLASNNEFDGLTQLFIEVKDEVKKERDVLPHSDFAKLKGVHHLKVFNAHKRGDLEGYVSEDDKLFIYTDQDIGE